jgi:hypothetical protein
MSKLKFTVAAAALIAGAVVSTAAGAQYPSAGYGYGYPAYSPPAYGVAPQNEFNNPATYGYRPRGLPHPNGPQPGGGGCFMGQAKNGCGDD